MRRHWTLKIKRIFVRWLEIEGTTIIFEYVANAGYHILPIQIF